jgi:hypothetical protein
MAPARILACQPQHERAHLGWHGRAPALAGRPPPLPAHERAMPPQQRPRSDQPRPTRQARQVARRRREQGTISGAKPRPRDLAAQDLELVAQDQQLDVLDVQATTTPNECAQKGPEREVEKREGHGRRSSQPSRRQRATGLLAPFTPLVGDATEHRRLRPCCSQTLEHGPRRGITHLVPSGHRSSLRARRPKLFQPRADDCLQVLSPRPRSRSGAARETSAARHQQPGSGAIRDADARRQDEETRLSASSRRARSAFSSPSRLAPPTDASRTHAQPSVRP